MNANVMIARRRRGLTQQALAKRLKLHRLLIVAIERYDWTPPKAIRSRLARVLSCAEHDLFAGESPLVESQS